MPASADLLKVLAEDPKSLEQQFGCMTGIFQIFDRHQAFIGRRYGSKRVSNASGEKLSLHFLFLSLSHLPLEMSLTISLRESDIY